VFNVKLHGTVQKNNQGPRTLVHFPDRRDLYSALQLCIKIYRPEYTQYNGKWHKVATTMNMVDKVMYYYDPLVYTERSNTCSVHCCRRRGLNPVHTDCAHTLYILLYSKDGLPSAMPMYIPG